MDNRELMVTIRCLAYNHEPYIRQCLDGFVMQKTNFRFEAIVHDDASTDGTADIIREYAEKYPDIIKPIFETENQYSKRDGSIRRIMDEHTHGKYVAMCEGDDYWIDPLKLQKQFDFMEQHNDCSLCFHAYEKLNNDGSRKIIKRYNSSLACCPKMDIINKPGSIMATNSMFYRMKLLTDYPQWARTAPVGDAPLALVLTTRGNVSYINEVMGCYRSNSIGSWTSKMSSDFSKRKKHYYAIMKMWKSFDNWSDYKYHK